MRTSKRLTLSAAAAGLLLASAASAAPTMGATGADDLKDKYEEKLAQSFVKKGGWIADFDAAKERAATEGKLIFAYFSRSYAP